MKGCPHRAIVGSPPRCFPRSRSSWPRPAAGPTQAPGPAGALERCPTAHRRGRTSRATSPPTAPACSSPPAAARSARTPCGWRRSTARRGLAAGGDDAGRAGSERPRGPRRGDCLRRRRLRHRAPADAAGGEATVVVDGRPGSIDDVVVTGDDLWWTTWVFDSPKRCEVARMPKAGGPVEVLAVDVASGLGRPLSRRRHRPARQPEGRAAGGRQAVRPRWWPARKSSAGR